MFVLKLLCLDCFCITRQLSCMYNISERINNAHFKLHPDTADDVTILSEGLVAEHKPKRDCQYGNKGSEVFLFSDVTCLKLPKFLAYLNLLVTEFWL